ncbi:MAG TPA: serine hydrolase domain-containing protein [Thermoanaerobaculia bacterium]|nr:serine hydrolase domain-containing protein [Thermoanaerobaculia bacterium]
MKRRAAVLQKVVHFLTAFVFVMKGVVKLEHPHGRELAIAFFFAAAAYIVVITLLHARLHAHARILDASVYALESIGTAIVAALYFGEGKRALPWFFVVASVAFAIAIVVRYRRGVAMAMLASVAMSLHADRVDDYMLRAMKLGHIPGAAVLVVQDGKVLKRATYGLASVEHNAPVTLDTRFQLASGTKALTGTALMLLVEDGKLSLDDPVSKYVPDAPESWKPITIRNLATHTTGFQEFPELTSTLTTAEAVRKIEEAPLRWAPGSREAYGNSDFTVMSFIIEKLTGMSFESFLHARLFEPLKMNATSFDDATETGRARIADVLPHRTPVYYWSDGRQKTYTFLYPKYTYSSGGLISTIRDMTSWVIAIDQEKLLPARALREMWTTPRSFAIGWIVGTYRGLHRVGHSGGPGLSDILRFPDRKLTVVVLQNQRKLYPWLAQGVADLYLGDVPPPPAPASAPQLDPRLEPLIRDLTRGKVDASRFEKPMLDELQDYVLPYILSLGSPTSITATEPLTARVLYGQKPTLWTFELTPEGRVASLEVRGE